jgi:hypothetical protein
VQPFVENDARDSFRHCGIACGVVHSKDMLSQDFGDARAINVNERLNLPVITRNPTQNPADGILAGLREKAAIAMEIDRDRGIELHAGNERVSANNIEAAGEEMRFQGKVVKALMQRSGYGSPLVVGHALVSKHNERKPGRDDDCRLD